MVLMEIPLHVSIINHSFSVLFIGSKAIINNNTIIVSIKNNF